MAEVDWANGLGVLNGSATGNGQEPSRARTVREVELLLVANGVTQPADGAGERFEAAAALLQSYREKSRLLADYRCPADGRIEAFLAEHLADLQLPEPLRLPANTLVLPRHGLARELSIPSS